MTKHVVTFYQLQDGVPTVGVEREVVQCFTGAVVSQGVRRGHHEKRVGPGTYDRSDKRLPSALTAARP